MHKQACTFFGHADCPEEIKPHLKETICAMIAKGIDTFYVGDKGKFDGYVRTVLKEVQTQYPYIHYSVVLAYLPQKQNFLDHSDTILPEGVEVGPIRFAIDRRNRWMLANADTVICYINHNWGGAAKFVAMAVQKGKKVINLGSLKTNPLNRG